MEAFEDWDYLDKQLKKHGSNVNKAINVMVSVLADALRKDKSAKKSNRVNIPEQEVIL